MPGRVGPNDTNFIHLQQELNPLISTPLRPNFAIAPLFDQLWGPTALKGRGRGESEVGIDRSNYGIPACTCGKGV